MKWPAATEFMYIVYNQAKLKKKSYFDRQRSGNMAVFGSTC